MVADAPRHDTCLNGLQNLPKKHFAGTLLPDVGVNDSHPIVFLKFV